MSTWTKQGAKTSEKEKGLTGDKEQEVLMRGKKKKKSVCVGVGGGGESYKYPKKF